MTYVLNPGKLSLTDIKILMDETAQITLSQESINAIQTGEEVINRAINKDQVVYGINTGFGALATERIPLSELKLLQKCLILSHAAGTGAPLSDRVVRLMLILKINSLARGYSGVRRVILDMLIALYNANMNPVIPSQGSVGASGDLAPLAHLSAVLLGEGSVRFHHEILDAREALSRLGLVPITLNPKEGLALVNGTQASTALALVGLFEAENIFFHALLAGAFSVDGARGSDQPFDPRIQLIRGHASQIEVAALLRTILNQSEIRESHRMCGKVQDPYSLRCQPQVMGACLAQIRYAAQILNVEANAVTDNPLVFGGDEEILSGGNFHAEPVAFAADALAVSIAEMGALSERRIALLIDPHFSHLPAFLVENPGLNSGFMIAQVTAASLASENKVYAHPASVDSIPTSANQEDHVSMATFAARRLLPMSENTTGIIGIELLAACQAIDLLAPLKTSKILSDAHQLIRSHVSFYKEDRYFAPDIAAIKDLVNSRELRKFFTINIL